MAMTEKDAEFVTLSGAKDSHSGAVQKEKEMDRMSSAFGMSGNYVAGMRGLTSSTRDLFCEKNCETCDEDDFSFSSRFALKTSS